MYQQPVWSFILGPLVEFKNAPDGYSSTCRDDLPEDEKNAFDFEVNESASLLRVLTALMGAAVRIDPDTIESSFSWSWVGGRARPTANLKMVRADKLPTSQELNFVCRTIELDDGRGWVRCVSNFRVDPPEA